MKRAGWLAVVVALLGGCIQVGKTEPPVLSDDPSAGPAACYSQCSVLEGCSSRCGYAVQH